MPAGLQPRAVSFQGSLLSGGGPRNSRMGRCFSLAAASTSSRHTTDCGAARMFRLARTGTPRNVMTHIIRRRLFEGSERVAVTETPLGSLFFATKLPFMKTGYPPLCGGQTDCFCFLRWVLTTDTPDLLSVEAR